MSGEIALAFPVGRDVRIKANAEFGCRYAGRTGTILSTEHGVELRIHGAPDPVNGSCYPAFPPAECELLPVGWQPERAPCGCDDSKALTAELAKVTRERDYLLQFCDPKEARAMQVELAAEGE